MRTINVNLLDTNFSHIEYSVPNKKFEAIKYRRNNFNNSDVFIFTDNFIKENLIKTIIAKKIAMPLECRQMIPGVYEYLEKNYHIFDYIFTHDINLLSKIPNGKYLPFGGCWIREPKIIKNKNKKISMFVSEKHFLEGHKFRHTILQKFNNFGIDFYGRSIKPVQFKEEGLNDYMFSIVVENAKIDGYFTEKLIDCLSVGTIPIYWGCSNIKDYFDDRGIFSFDSLEELEELLSRIDEKFYENKLEYIQNNFDISLKYDMLEKHLYSLLINV